MLHRAVPAGYTECFNVRDERLNENWFLDPAEARHKIANWKSDYNQVRPRLALGSDVDRVREIVGDNGPWTRRTAEGSKSRLVHRV